MSAPISETERWIMNTNEFVDSLTLGQRELMLRLALQGARDELADGFMRENAQDMADVVDEELEALTGKLSAFFFARPKL